MKVLVCGSRHFYNYALLKEILDEEFPCKGFLDYSIITGGAMGADTLAEDYAVREDIPYQVFSANWDKYGKAAGPIRNKQMLDEGKPDLVIAFLASNSKGTKDMINQATEAGVPVKVINI